MIVILKRSVNTFQKDDSPDVILFARRYLRVLIVLLSVAIDLATQCHLRGEDEAAQNIVASFDLARDDDDAPVVPVTIADTDYPFLVDTGASYNVVDSSLRSLLGSTKGYVKTVVPGAEPWLEEVQPRGLRIRAMPVFGRAIVADLSGVRRRNGGQYFGLIGMSFLFDHVIRYDAANGKLSFLKSASGEDGEAVKLHFTDSGIPCVSAEINKRSVRFLVDTGCTGTGSLLSEVVDELHASGGARLVALRASSTLGGTCVYRVLDVKCLVLGKFDHRSIQFDDGEFNHLGTGYWSRYVATFDFPKRTLYLQRGLRYSENQDEQFPTSSGMRLRRDDDGVEVASVAVNGEAWNAGIRPLDAIIEIAGEAVSMKTIERINAVLSSGRVDVTIRQATTGTVMRVRLNSVGSQ